MALGKQTRGAAGWTPSADEVRRVLTALCRAEGDPATQMLALRRIAAASLEDDSERAVAVLSELDALGYVRTDIMGWHRGWLTEKGRRAASGHESST